MMKDSYYKVSTNSERYVTRKNSLDKLFESERYFLKDMLFDHATVLDVGCGGGALSQALKQVNPSICYSGIDIDPKTIELGKQYYHDITLKVGRFPEDLVVNDKYDIVTMFGLFPHLPDWKENLIALANHAKKTINVSVTLRLNGPTIVDEDTSFFYYLDSGGRIMFIVHNLFELINFCCIEKMRAKSIKIYGYYLKSPSTLYYPLPQSEVIKANMLIDLLPEGFTVRRVGGVMQGELDVENSFRPEIDILIDGKRFDTISGKLG